MKEVYNPLLGLSNVLQSIYRRNCALFLSKLILTESSIQQSAFYQRHYDLECEAATQIVDILQTAQQKHQLCAIMRIKSTSSQRFRRSSYRHNSESKGQRITRKKSSEFWRSQAERSYSIHRSERRNHEETHNNEVSELFQRVRKFAVNELQLLPKQSDLAVRKEKILGRITELQVDISHWLDTQKSISTNNDHYSSMRENKYQSAVLPGDNLLKASGKTLRERKTRILKSSNLMPSFIY